MNISNAATNTTKISSEVANFIMTPQTNKCGCFNINDYSEIDEAGEHKNKHL